MAQNKAGPYQVRVPYVAIDGVDHTLRLNCIVADGPPIPGAPPSTVTLVTRGGGISLQSGVDEMWAAIRQALPTTTAAGGYELWRIPEAGDPQFVTAGDLTTPNGAGGALVPNWSEIYTFRSANGGIAKIQLMDTIEAGNAKIPTSLAMSPVAWAVGSTSWMIARDDGFIIAGISLAQGQHEATFKRRHRR